ncbi:MAG: hypothetical protein Kow0042_28860 [Calditrichia bacterium]
MIGLERKINITLSVDEDLYRYYHTLGRTIPLNFTEENRHANEKFRGKDLNKIVENIFIEEIESFITDQILREARQKLPHNIIEQFKYLMEAVRDNPAIHRLRFKIPDIDERIQKRIYGVLEKQGMKPRELRKFLSEEELEELGFPQ